jgi:hypothetical protein
MRLGFRKAGRGRTRGKNDSTKKPSAAASAASKSGWADPWPPPCPDELMSGRGGSGAGGSRCGTTPAGALWGARARGARGLRPSPLTSVARAVAATSAVLWALLTSVERDMAPTMECGFGRPETSRPSRSRARPARGGAAGGALPAFVEVSEITGAAAVVVGCVAAASSVSRLAAAGGAGMVIVVALATFMVTLWSSRAGACGSTASTSARAASTSADTSMPAGPAARAVPGPASPLQAIAPANAHTRASQGTPRPAASAASAKREVSLLFSMLRSVAGDANFRRNH